MVPPPRTGVPEAAGGAALAGERIRTRRGHHDIGWAWLGVYGPIDLASWPSLCCRLARDAALLQGTHRGTHTKGTKKSLNKKKIKKRKIIKEKPVRPEPSPGFRPSHPPHIVSSRIDAVVLAIPADCQSQPELFGQAASLLATPDLLAAPAPTRTLPRISSCSSCSLSQPARPDSSARPIDHAPSRAPSLVHRAARFSVPPVPLRSSRVLQGVDGLRSRLAPWHLSR